MAETISFAGRFIKVACASAHRTALPVGWTGDTLTTNGQGHQANAATVDLVGIDEPVELYEESWATASLSYPIAYVINRLTPLVSYEVRCYFTAPDSMQPVVDVSVVGNTTDGDTNLDIEDSSGVLEAFRTTYTVEADADGEIALTVNATSGHPAILCGFDVYPVPSPTNTEAPFASDTNAPTTHPYTPFTVDNNAPTTNPLPIL